jgi:hypothetical protein
MNQWNNLATDDQIQKTKLALEKNGFNVEVVTTSQEAKQKVLSLVPEKLEVQVNTSVTLETIGILEEMDNSGRFDSVRNKTMAMNKETQEKDMRKLRSVPDYSLGSVHAVTQTGELLIASRTGSQIPSYAYGAEKVVFVVGTQKLVSDINNGIKRIYEHSLPLESDRATKAYGTNGSSVNKILILAQEPIKDRTTVVLVKEVLGF